MGFAIKYVNLHRMFKRTYLGFPEQKYNVTGRSFCQKTSAQFLGYYVDDYRKKGLRVWLVVRTWWATGVYPVATICKRLFRKILLQEISLT